MVLIKHSPTAGDAQGRDEASRFPINQDSSEGRSSWIDIAPLEILFGAEISTSRFRSNPTSASPSVSFRVEEDTHQLGMLINIVANHGWLDLSEVVASQITNGVGDLGVTSINSVDPQGNNNGEVRVNIDPAATEHVDGAAGTRLSRALIAGAVLTVGMDIGTALYRPAGGVVFGRNKALYYMVLAAIVLWGVGQALTGIWLSGSRQISNGRFLCGKIVLALSLIPFCGIVGVSGFSFMHS